jgi:hypothetical protein
MRALCGMFSNVRACKAHPTKLRAVSGIPWQQLTRT